MFHYVDGMPAQGSDTHLWAYRAGELRYPGKGSQPIPALRLSSPDGLSELAVRRQLQEIELWSLEVIMEALEDLLGNAT